MRQTGEVQNFCCGAGEKRSLLVNTAVLCWIAYSHLLGMAPLGTAARAQAISHGPILGRPSATGVGVWARTSRAGQFRIRYGSESGRLEEVSDPAVTSVDRDNTGWVELDDLVPDTKYFFEVFVPGGEEPAAEHRGSFRTLPDATQHRDPTLNPRGLFNFRFEFACGNNQNAEHGSGPTVPGFGTMLAELKDRIHFAIQNGDWLYEDARDYPADQWHQQVGLTAAEATPPVVQVAPTIVGVWENYKTYLNRGRNLAAWHRHVPNYFTFDDHEILNDVWGAGSPGLRDRRATFRDIGVQAWYDYLGWSNPVRFTQGIRFGKARLRAGNDVLVDDEADFASLDLQQAATLHVHWGGASAGVNDNALDGVGGDPNAGVYEIVEVLDANRLRIRPAADTDGTASYSIGRRSYYRFRVSNCEFFVLDTRTHREMHDTARPAQPGLSMLGRRQREWLLEGMRASDADFLFVVSSVNFMVPHVGGAKIRTSNKDDAWTVFLDEREALIEAWDRLDRPVFVLTGDLHNSFVIKITDRVWEFASGPHNSSNHWYTDEGGRPASGPFQYGPRECDIRWSSFFRDDIPRESLTHPFYCEVQVNNVFDNPIDRDRPRWVAFERPQVVFQYYDALRGELRYAESIVAER